MMNASFFQMRHRLRKRERCRRRCMATMGFIAACMQVMANPVHSFSADHPRGFDLDLDPNMKTKIASSMAKTERREVERSRNVGREVCERCSRPPPLCVCSSLPAKLIDTSTTVLILQHPRERRRKSLSTVPLMPLCLEKCTVKVGYEFALEELDLVTECIGRGQRPLLLFPGPDAISLDDDNSDNILQSLQDNEQLLVLIDGTWNEARGVIYRSPELINECQHIKFQSETESIYPVELRKEPEKHCLSTLESCANALVLLEPSSERAMEAKEFLEGSMRCMVEKRMSVSESRNRSPRFSRPGSKIFEKNKRRHEIKQQLF